MEFERSIAHSGVESSKRKLALVLAGTVLIAGCATQTSVSQPVRENSMNEAVDPTGQTNTGARKAKTDSPIMMMLAGANGMADVEGGDRIKFQQDVLIRAVTGVSDRQKEETLREAKLAGFDPEAIRRAALSENQRNVISTHATALGGVVDSNVRNEQGLLRGTEELKKRLPEIRHQLEAQLPELEGQERGQAAQSVLSSYFIVLETMFISNAKEAKNEEECLAALRIIYTAANGRADIEGEDRGAFRQDALTRAGTGISEQQKENIMRAARQVGFTPEEIRGAGKQLNVSSTFLDELLSSALPEETTTQQKYLLNGVQIISERLTATVGELEGESGPYQWGEKTNSQGRGEYTNAIKIDSERFDAGVTFLPGEHKSFAVGFPPSKDKDPQRKNAGAWGTMINDFAGMIKQVSKQDMTRAELLIERTTEKGDPVINTYALPLNSKGDKIGKYKGGYLAIEASYYPTKGVVYGGYALLLEPGVQEPTGP